MKSNRIKALVVSVAMIASCGTSYIFSASAENQTYDMTLTVNVSGESKQIDPRIYGINDAAALKKVTTTALRQGGNRMTGYNWENNYSNAGEDWFNSSDTNVSSSSTPGDAALQLSSNCQKNNINYKFTTLQMAGYVSADKNGTVNEDEAAPSSRWKEVLFRKDSDLSLEPDLTDDYVYMDEYVNYIVKTLGDSGKSTGMQGYSLDNEPALWNNTHPLLHPKEVTPEELTTKSVELAKVVKEIDPGADVFGPALWGYLSCKQLGDDDSTGAWDSIKSSGGYNWFIDYYLDEMKKASDETGYRLIDYLDFHYYAQAKDTQEDILQGVRTLYDDNYIENSWIGQMKQWAPTDLPILPNIKNAIDKYYPGTKIAISEYSFNGGQNIEGAVAEAEALGCFAENEVSLATFWDVDSGSPYIYSAINLFTNYDGNGSYFGNLLLDSETEDNSKSNIYAAINSCGRGSGINDINPKTDAIDDETIDLVVTNKDQSMDENATIKIENTSREYKSALVYGIVEGSSDIVLLDKISNIENNTINYTLPSVSVVHIVANVDPDAYNDVQITEPTEEPSHETVVISGFDKTDAGISFTVDRPNDIEKIVIDADISTNAGSSYYGGGGGLCFTIDTDSSKNQWASKSFSFSNSQTSAEVDFDGTFTVPVDDSSEEMKGTIVNNTIEVQTWWAYSEKNQSGEDVSISYKSITVYYKDSEVTTEPTETDSSETEVSSSETQPTETQSTETEPTETEPSESTEPKTIETGVPVSKCGDVNCDDKINVADVILLNKYIVGADIITDQGYSNAECYADGIIDINDSAQIMNVVVMTLSESQLPVKP